MAKKKSKAAKIGTTGTLMGEGKSMMNEPLIKTETQPLAAPAGAKKSKKKKKQTNGAPTPAFPTQSHLSTAYPKVMKTTIPEGYSLVFRVCRQMELYKLRRKGFLSSSNPTRKDLCLKILDKHLCQHGPISHYSNVLSFSTNLDWIFYYYCKSVMLGTPHLITMHLVKTEDLLDPLDFLPRHSRAYKACVLANEKVAVSTIRVYRFWVFSLCDQPNFMNGVMHLFSSMYQSQDTLLFPYEMWNGETKHVMKFKKALYRKKQWHLWLPKPSKKSKFVTATKDLPKYMVCMCSDEMKVVEPASRASVKQALAAHPIRVQTGLVPPILAQSRLHVLPAVSPAHADNRATLETTEDSQDSELSFFSNSDMTSYDLMESDEDLTEMFKGMSLN